MKKIFSLFLFILILFSIAGCGNWVKKQGINFAGGMVKKTDSISIKAIAGFLNGLNDPNSQKKIDSILNKLALSLQQSGGSFLANITDSLIQVSDSLLGVSIKNHAAEILETLTGKKLRSNLNELLNTVLNDGTKEKIKSLLNSVIDELLNDHVKPQLLGILDSAGSLATIKVGVLVDSSLNKMKRGLNVVSNKTQQNISYLQQHAITFLATALALIVAAIVLIVIFIRRKEKFAKATNVMANSIEENKSSLDIQSLKSTIKNKALDADVEKFLNTFLKKKGIISREKKSEEPPVEKK